MVISLFINIFCSKLFHFIFTGHSNSSSISQSHHYHPSLSHTNTLQSSQTGNYAQMSNGNDNTSHSSYSNNTNHIAGLQKQIIS